MRVEMVHLKEGSEQDERVEKMLQRYLSQPTNLWLYSDLPIEDRMALAYLASDEFMDAKYKGDQVRQFVDAVKSVINKPEAFWEQIGEKDSERLKRLKSLDWSLEVVALEDIGVYPHFGGFPRSWSYGNVVDTASAFSEGTDSPDKKHEVLTMVPRWMTVLKFLPPVLVPGEMLRAKDPKYEKTKWAIDDGNHRVLAAALGGAKEIVAFVGRKKVKVSMIDHFNFHDRGIDRNPDYSKGQPHTDYGERGSSEVNGIKFSDLFQAVSVAIKESCTDEQEFDELKIDPESVSQNVTCNVEKLMGIYPNVPQFSLNPVVLGERDLWKQAQDTVTISFECTEPASEELVSLIEYVGKNGNSGHSFEIVVDPDDSENKESFFFDGDGSDYIDVDSIKVAEKKRVGFKVDLKIGDTILTGRWKNVKSIVKGFGTNDKGQPTVVTDKGEVPMFKFRIKKLMP
jgi:hypothetical protein